MRSRIPYVLCAALVVTGCARKVDRPSAEACQKTCDHVAQLEDLAVIAADQANLHEMGETNEADANTSKMELARLKALLAIPRPKFETTAEAREKVSPERMRAYRHRYEAEGVEARRALELAIKSNGEFVAAGLARFEVAKKAAKEKLEKAHKASVERCLAACASRYTSVVAECLLKAREPEDLDSCGSGAPPQTPPQAGTK